MNYYIQGDAANADQIKAAFEKLGIDVLDFGFADKAAVYFSIGGCVQCVPYSINIMNILHSHPDYKELELPIEPKFKIGDWIACDADSFTLSIKSVRDVNYYFHQGESLPIKYIDEHYHLWSIADAKDGDVLVMEKTPINHESIFIFQKINEASVIHYCYYFNDNGEEVFGKRISNNIIGHTNQSFHPATKEQRNLLFQKMGESGYVWDKEKKELRKIEPHYDISNFHAGMPVLVRDNEGEEWRYTTFSHVTSRFYENKFAAGCTYWSQCIPFNDDTKHLLGTTDMPSEEYINW